MQNDLTFVKPLVAGILRDTTREWTVQGFGFLRTYFGPPDAPKQFRLNLWDSEFTVPNVSVIHDHPWDFKSLIVAGETGNQRYLISKLKSLGAPTHAVTTITCGVEGKGAKYTSWDACVLTPEPFEHYYAGHVYAQRAREIHETKFLDGSVTLNERVGDTQHARVFWPWGTHWVDATPRPATSEEVSTAVNRSLERWFS
jgi:hypothetical protein